MASVIPHKVVRMSQGPHKVASERGPTLELMQLCPNSGQRANALATNAKRIHTEHYGALCPACEQTVVVRISHEGMMAGRTERWSEHYVPSEDAEVPAL